MTVERTRRAPTPADVNLTQRLIHTRNVLREMFGAEYPGMVAPLRKVIADAFGRTGEPVLVLAARACEGEPDPIAVAWIVAAAVDEIEAEGRLVS